MLKMRVSFFKPIDAVNHSLLCVLYKEDTKLSRRLKGR